jgi:hypothetical protein
MTLQSSGAISLGDIAEEYGDDAPHSLSEFYDKGNAPASGEISLADDFYGTANLMAAWWLAIGGGGGAGQFYGGGGGGGGYLENTSASLIRGSQLTVTVGTGGAGAQVGNTAGTNGSNSVFGDGIAYGGGGGGSEQNNGKDGGSGGGTRFLTPGESIQTDLYGGTGYGGRGQSAEDAGGGGGAGGDAPGSGGYRAGGDGKSSSITGSSYIYAPGGRGQNANAGEAPGWGNYGSGGNGDGGNGFTGVVILRYATSIGSLTVGSGLTYTTGTVGSDTYYKFTGGTGTITLP